MPSKVVEEPLQLRSLFIALGKSTVPFLILVYAVVQFIEVTLSLPLSKALVVLDTARIVAASCIVISLIIISYSLDELILPYDTINLLTGLDIVQNKLLLRAKTHSRHVVIVISLYQCALVLIVFLSGALDQSAVFESKLGECLSVLVGGLGIQLSIEFPRLRQSQLKKYISVHGNVTYLTRDEEVLCRGNAVKSMSSSDRMLLVTTQKLKTGMHEGTNYIDEDFMEFWFREINEKKHSMEQIVLLSNVKDVRDFLLRVEKFKACRNVRLGYILGPQALLYADIFTIPGKLVLISFSDDVTQRNLATYGLRLTGPHVVGSFTRLYDRVFVQEAKWVKTFEGVDPVAVQQLKTDFRILHGEIEHTKLIKQLGW